MKSSLPLTAAKPMETPWADPALWPLDPEITFLNHGSFGSCPRPVLQEQTSWRDRLERQPVQFLVRELEPLLDNARRALAAMVGANADNLVLVANATSGVNTVLRSLAFQAGDELLVTNHEYNACRNALDYIAARNGATIVVARVPFPVSSADEIHQSILERVTPRTRLALLDHVTSQTGLVFPIEALVKALRERGVDTLVDGAHAPGMVPLNLERIAPAYYTGNCHKWLCAPKGAAFLYVSPHRQETIRPLTISHGANSRRDDRSRFLVEFGWVGTTDPSAFLAIPAALDFMSGLLEGQWPQIMAVNRSLALTGRRILCDALEIEAPAPEDLLGSLASIFVPGPSESSSPLYADPLQEKLLRHYSIEVPIIPWPADEEGCPPRRLLRISAQLYNCGAQYEQLAGALRECFAL